MNSNLVIELAKHALEIIVALSTPVLVVGMVVGLLVSIIQTVTSIQDSTLSSVPKLAAILITLFLLAGWMLDVLVSYTRELLGDFTRYIA